MNFNDKVLANRKIGIIGFGNMASAVIGRILDNEGISPRQIFSLKHKKLKDDAIKKKYKIRILDCIEDLCLKCNTLFIAVKPQQLDDILPHLKPYVDKQLVITVIAGVRTKKYQQQLGRGIKIIRAMPNTPATVGYGMTGLFASSSCTKKDIAVGEALFGSVGDVLQVKSENEMDALTAVSGSGPAFVYEFAQALIDAAKSQGLTQSKAQTLVYNTLRGASEVLLEAEETPSQLIKKVASKGGSTQKGLDVLKKKRLAQTVNSCIVAAVQRNKELGK